MLNIDLEPQNIEAEKNYLSCILNNYENIHNTKVIANNFFDNTNKEIFKAILSKGTVDITVLSNEL
jgi:replicative DNA helicase